MRILQLMADGSPGGGPANVLGLMEDLHGEGNLEFELWSQADSYAIRRADRMGISTRGVDFFRSRLDVFTGRNLRGLIDRNSFDLIHAHGLRAAFLVTLLGIRRLSIPFVYTVRGYHFPKRSFPLRTLLRWAEKRIYRLADRIVFECEHDRNMGRSEDIVTDAGRSDIIYNGLDLSEFPEPSPGNPRLVGFLGRLTYQKNVSGLLEVARLLVPEGYRFRIIGGGDQEAWLRKRIREENLEDSINVTGSLPRVEALEALREVGVLLMPSRWEGFPLVPLEAMALKIPVVAARVGGIPEAVDHEGSGLLIEDGKPGDYAAAVRRLADNDSLRRKLIEQGYETVRERFSRRETAHRHRELYREILS